MYSESNPRGLFSNIVVQNLEDELLIYNLETHQAYSLNSISARIWNLCDGNHNVSDISRKLSRDSHQAVPEELVVFALNDFQKENLLSAPWKPEAEFSKLSRREVIRKVGFTSMAALPVITSLIAPTAAHAASTCPLAARGVSCTCSNGAGSSCASAACAAGCTCSNLGALNTGGGGLRLGSCH